MFIQQTLLYLPAQVVSTIVQFLAVIAWTHYLEPADFGRLNLVVVVHELLFLLLLWWWTVYTLRSFSNWSEVERRQRFERTEGFVLFAALCFHIVLVAVVVATAVDRSASIALVASSIVFAVSRSLVMHLSERTRTSQEIGLYTVLQISWSMVGFGLGLILVLTFGSSAIWPLLGTAAAQLLAAAYVMWRVRLRPFSLRPDMEIVRAAAKFGFPLVAAGLLGWVAMYGNRFIIEYFLGHAAVGLFSVGSGLADRSIALAITLVGAATLPLAIQDMRESGAPAAMQRLKTGSVAALGLMIPSAVGISVLATPIAEILVGSQYREATILILPIATWSAVIYGGWCMLPAQALIVLDKPVLLVWAAAVVAIVSTILSVVLIQWFDIVGVACARLAALSVTFMVFCQICASRFGMLFPGRELVKMFVSVFLMAVGLWVLPSPRTLLGLAATIAFGATIYLSVALLLFRDEIRPIAKSWRIKLADWTKAYDADGT